MPGELLPEPLEGKQRLGKEKLRARAATERQYFAASASREALAEEVAGIAFAHRTWVVLEPAHPSQTQEERIPDMGHLVSEIELQQPVTAGA